MQEITEKELQEKKKLLKGTIIAYVQAEDQEEKRLLVIQGGVLTKWFFEHGLVSKLESCFEEAYQLLGVEINTEQKKEENNADNHV